MIGKLRFLEYVFPKEIKPILLLGVLIRLSVAAFAWILGKSFKVFYSYDTDSYVQPALEWISTGKFSNLGKPEIFRTPGYPTLLIPGVAVHQIEVVTLALQISLSCISILLIYLIAKKLYNKREVALFCAFFYAIEPLSILYANKLLSETLFTTVLLIFVYIIIRYLSDRTIKTLILSALMLALLVYIRPIAYYLPLYLVIVIGLVDLLTRQHSIRTLAHLVLLLSLSYGLIGFWQWRNYSLTGYSGFSTVSDINMFFFHGAAVQAVNRGVPLYEMQDQLGYRDENIYTSLHPDQEDWTPSQRYSYFRAEGTRIVLNNISTYAIVYLIGLGRTLTDPGAVEFLRLFNAYPLEGGLFGVLVDRGVTKTFTQILTVLTAFPQLGIILFILAMMLFGLYLFAGIALIKVSYRNNWNLIITLLIGLYFLLLAGGPLAADRFRQPIMPFVCLLAGYGAWVMSIKLKSSSNRLIFRINNQ